MRHGLSFEHHPVHAIAKSIGPTALFIGPSDLGELVMAEPLPGLRF